MIGLGVGIDYALLIVTRYRTELSSGADPRGAASIAMATAGRSVVFAGVTVVISLLGMLMMSQPYVAGVAFSSVLTVLAVMLAALTLLPALLGFTGRNIDRLRMPFRHPSEDQAGRGVWYRWSRTVQRRPVVTGLAGLLALGVLIAPVAGLELGFPDAGNDPTNLTTRRAYDLMTDGFGAGFNGAFVLVADRGDSAALADLGRPRSHARDDTRSRRGLSADREPERRRRRDHAHARGEPARPRHQRRSSSRLRSDIVPHAMAGTDVNVVIGGITAADVDQTNSISARLPYFIAAVIVLSFLLLMAVFRSVLVAAKAAVLNLLSIIAAYGVVAYACEGGWFGQLFGITTATPVPAFIPMMMFAILFGLSMDYEVFLLSRVREEYLKTGDNSTAVADGLAATAKVITAAALIMTAVFGAFVLDDQIFLKIIGIGMAAAVVIDATIIRLVLVPASMELLGDKNWWMPRWLDRTHPPPRHRRHRRHRATARRRRQPRARHRLIGEHDATRHPPPVLHPPIDHRPALDADVPRLPRRRVRCQDPRGTRRRPARRSPRRRADGRHPRTRSVARDASLWSIARGVDRRHGGRIRGRSRRGRVSRGLRDHDRRPRPPGRDLRCGHRSRRRPSSCTADWDRSRGPGPLSWPGSGRSDGRSPPLAGVDVEAQYTVFGSTGAIVVTAGTAILPIVLTRRAASVVAIELVEELLPRAS